MDGVTDTEIESVPPQFKDVTATFCSFFKVLRTLEIAVNADRVVKCVVLGTKTNDIIEIQNGELKRVQKLGIKTFSKIVVHHQYDPFRRYMAILTAAEVAYLLDYDTLKIINSWNGVKDIVSEDVSEKGRPELVLYKISGELYSVSEGDFLVESGSSDMGKGRSDAVFALNNKLKSCVWLAESLEAEKRIKEMFICRKVSDIAVQLKQNETATPIAGSSNAVQPSPLYSTETSSSSRQPLPRAEKELNGNVEPMKVLASRQRIIHGKWVICIPVINQSESFVLRNLDMILHPCPEGLKSLHFTTRLMKTFRRTTVKKTHLAAQENDVIIEDLEPPVLKPKKKAFMIALCDIPSFSLCEAVLCGGIITFESRKMNPGTECISNKLCQQSFASVQLSAKNLKSLCVEVTREQGNAGLSFDLFALIAASVCFKMEINSIASPLHQFIESLSQDQRITKIRDLSDFYCFNTTGCDPLHLSAFVCKLISAHQILFTIYVRDYNQGMLLIHNLKPLLPMDAYIVGKTSESDSSIFGSTKESVYGDLLSKMKLNISTVKDAFENVGSDPEQKKYKSGVGSSTDSARVLQSNTEPTKKVCLEWEEEKYMKWREELHRLSFEMESLFR